MKNKINIDDFLLLMYWVQTFIVFEGKKFKHVNLLEQAETYKLNNTPLNTNIHSIDEFVIDAYSVYKKIKDTEDKLNELLYVIKLPFDNNVMVEEITNYKHIFEELMENYKYDYPEARAIQKGILSEKINEYVAIEDYENAAKLRDIIKYC